MLFHRYGIFVSVCILVILVNTQLINAVPPLWYAYISMDSFGISQYSPSQTKGHSLLCTSLGIL